MTTVYSLKRNDLTGALALFKSRRLTSDEVSTLLRLQDTPSILMAAMVVAARARDERADYDPDQPRAEDGRFGETAGEKKSGGDAEQQRRAALVTEARKAMADERHAKHRAPLGTDAPKGWDKPAVEPGTIAPEVAAAKIEDLKAKVADAAVPWQERAKAEAEILTTRQAAYQPGSRVPLTYDNLDAISRPGHLYRGMEPAEYEATVGAGAGVLSRNDYSVGHIEGTSLGYDAGTASSYVNLGRSNPRLTGKPNYIVEMRASPHATYNKSAGYPQSAIGHAIPQTEVTRVWRVEGEGEAPEGVMGGLGMDGLVMQEITPPDDRDRLDHARTDYDENQPRAENGQWGDGGGGSSSEKGERTRVAAAVKTGGGGFKGAKAAYKEVAKQTPKPPDVNDPADRARWHREEDAHRERVAALVDGLTDDEVFDLIVGGPEDQAIVRYLPLKPAFDKAPFAATAGKFKAKDYDPLTGERTNAEGARSVPDMHRWARQVGLDVLGQEAGEAVFSRYVSSPQPFNNPARAGDINDDVRALDAIIAARRMPEALTVYRGVRGGPLAAAKVGDVVEELGFMSTSPKGGTAETFAAIGPADGVRTIVEFDLPEGTPVGVSGMERELLLGRGHRLEIIEEAPAPVSVRAVPGNVPVRMIRARLLPPAATRADAGEARRLRLLTDRARAVLDRGVRPELIEALAKKYAARTADHQHAEFGRQMKAAIGVDPFIQDRKLAALTEDFVENNVSLIKRIPARLHDKVEALVQRAATSGRRHESLADELVAEFGIAERHARLIARDQIGKFYGDVNEARQKELGISRFTWRTVNDERVRGNPDGKYPKAETSHHALDGKIFAWDELPRGADGEPISPGFEISCRCTAEPVVEDVLNSLPEPPDDF